MNKDLLDYFKAHEETAFKFNLELRNLKELLRSKIKKVAQCVERPERFPRFSYWSSLSDVDETFAFICDSCNCFTELAGVSVQIEVTIYIDDRGWQIVVWLPQGGDFSKVCKWLEEHEIPPARIDQNKKYWIYAKYKDPDLSLAEEKVGAKFQELLEAITKGIGPKAMQSRSEASKKRQ